MQGRAPNIIRPEINSYQVPSYNLDEQFSEQVFNPVPRPVLIDTYQKPELKRANFSIEPAKELVLFDSLTLLAVVAVIVCTTVIILKAFKK